LQRKEAEEVKKEAERTKTKLVKQWEGEKDRAKKIQMRRTQEEKERQSRMEERRKEYGHKAFAEWLGGHVEKLKLKQEERQIELDKLRDQHRYE